HVICHSVPMKHCKIGKHKDFLVPFPCLRLSTPELRSGGKTPVEVIGLLGILTLWSYGGHIGRKYTINLK
ncbi:MAG TPA: hypothetical protein PKA00_09340, partial [Saprospiraceae bacterium]|nr:hypothetical protein [Saprospiraceae bacterium]HMQ83101.1 hypothetical protein [Saprospiraceae bacterium]